MIQLSNEEYAGLVGERDALTAKATALESALKRAHDLILHIEDVLPDESFDLIDTTSWNAATSDMRVGLSELSTRTNSRAMSPCSTC